MYSSQSAWTNSNVPMKKPQSWYEVSPPRVESYEEMFQRSRREIRGTDQQNSSAYRVNPTTHIQGIPRPVSPNPFARVHGEPQFRPPRPLPTPDRRRGRPLEEMTDNERREYYDYLANISHNVHQDYRNRGYTDRDFQENEDLYTELNNIMANAAANWKLDNGFI